jgi:hypothetical protein
MPVEVNKELPTDGYWRFDEQHLSEEEIDRIPVKNQVNVFGFACNQTAALLIVDDKTTTRSAAQLPACLDSPHRSR